MQYNEERSHESFGNLAPAEFLKKFSPTDVSVYGWPNLGRFTNGPGFVS